MQESDDEANERERRLRQETLERLKRIKQKARDAETQRELERQERLKQKRIQHQTFTQQPVPAPVTQQNNAKAPASLQDQMKADFDKYLKNIQQYTSMDLSYLKPLQSDQNQDKKAFIKAVHDQYKGKPTSSAASERNTQHQSQRGNGLSKGGISSQLNQQQIEKSQKPSQPNSHTHSEQNDLSIDDSDDLNQEDLYASQVKLLPETAVSTSDEEDLNKSMQRTKQEIQQQQMMHLPSKKYQQDFSQVVDKKGVRVVSKSSQRQQLDTSKVPKPIKSINSQVKTSQSQNNQIKNKLSLLKQQTQNNSSSQLQNKQPGSRSVSSLSNKKQPKLSVKPETLQEYKRIQLKLEQIEKEENQIAADLVKINDKIEYITNQGQYVESLIQNLSIIKADKSPNPPVSNGNESQLSMASVFQSKAVSGMSPTQQHNINKANTLVEDNEDLQALIERLNDLPDIQDSNEYTDEEKALVRDERIRLVTLIKQFQSRLIMNRVRNTTKVNKMQVIDPIAKTKLPPSMNGGKQNLQPEKAKSSQPRNTSQPFKSVPKKEQQSEINDNQVNNELFALSSAEPFNNTVKHIQPPNNDVENRSLLNALFGENKPVQNMKTMYQRNTMKSRPQSVNNNPPVQVKQQPIDESAVDQNDEPLYVNKAKYLDSATQEDENDGIYQIENNVKSYEQQKYEQFLKRYEDNEDKSDQEEYQDAYQEQFGLYDMMQQGQVGQESDDDYDFTGV